MNAFITSLGKPSNHGYEQYLWYPKKLLARTRAFNYTDLDNADVVFLPFMANGLYKYDEASFAEVAAKGLPIVVFDFTEYADQLLNPVMLGTSLIGTFPGTDVERLSVAMAGLNRTKLYFKREFPVTMPEMPMKVMPLEFCVEKDRDFPVVSLESFQQRPIDILMVCNWTHPSRLEMFAELLRRSSEFGGGYSFAMTAEDVRFKVSAGQTKIIALLRRTDNNRLPLGEVYNLQEQAKITVSLIGAGLKCFRSNEASRNSLMAQQSPELLRWSYPWQAGVNCLGLPSKEDWQTVDSKAGVDVMLNALRGDVKQMHLMYLSGVENSHRYVFETYIKDYLVPAITQAF